MKIKDILKRLDKLDHCFNCSAQWHENYTTLQKRIKELEDDIRKSIDVDEKKEGGQL